jgi:hypothetical protein
MLNMGNQNMKLKSLLLTTFFAAGLSAAQAADGELSIERRAPIRRGAWPMRPATSPASTPMSETCSVPSWN